MEFLTVRYYACLACVSAAHFIQKPIRDEVLVNWGLKNVHWVMISSFLVSIIIALSIRDFKDSRRLLSGLLIGLAFLTGISFWFYDANGFAPIYCVIVGALNLTILSVTGSHFVHASDFNKKIISGLGIALTMGALAGPLIVTLFGLTGQVSLLLAGSLLLVAFALLPSTHQASFAPASTENALKLNLALNTFLYTLISTIIYILFIGQVSQSVNSENRFLAFSISEIIVNASSILVALTASIRSPLWSSAILPLSAGAVFLSGNAAAVPLALTFKTLKSGLRSTRPDIQISQHTSLQLKTFNETVVYRLGDVAGACLVVFSASAGLSKEVLAVLGISLCAIWYLSNRLLLKLKPAGHEKN